MNKKIIYTLVAVVGILSAVSFFPRGLVPVVYAGDASQRTTTQDQTQASENNLSKLVQQVPIPQLDNSLERANISKRLTTFSDPAKISYIYLVNYGRVMAFYTVKGKITSGNKRLTSGQQIIQDSGYNQGSFSVIDAPELDGTYGSSAPYVYFWTTDGVYVQWSGDYMLVDQPLQLTSQPELIRTVK